MQKISIHPTETCIKSNFGTAYYEILFWAPIKQKHFFKNHYWENPQNPFKNLQNKKKDKGNISFVFLLLQRKTHPLESMAKCALQEKITYLILV